MNTEQPPITFEYCALRFLFLWEQRERVLHEKIKSRPTSDDIRKALKHFQVARNFKGLDENNAKTIADAVETIFKAKDKTAEQKVKVLASLFKANFGQYNLSAASKLLWLRGRKVIIYDARAVSALKKRGHKFEKVDYQQYCDSWRKEFSEYKSDIERAAARLLEVKAFILAWHDDGELEKLSRTKWFVERVFDIYLWEEGG